MKRKIIRLQVLLFAVVVPVLPGCKPTSADRAALAESDIVDVRGALISDAPRGGTTSFYWLPPIVPRPVARGRLDTSAQPVVRVDELGALRRFEGADPQFELGGITEVAAGMPQCPDRGR